MTGMIYLGHASAPLLTDGIAYLTGNDWRILVKFGIAIPFLILSIPNFFMPESPRFFVNRGKDHLILKNLNLIAKYNNKPYLTENDIDFTKLNNPNALLDRKVQYSHLFIFKSVRW